MPIDQIITRAIEDNAVVTETLVNGSITTSKIPDGSITEDKFTQEAINSVSALRFANVSGPSGVGFTDLNSVETVTINGAGFQSGVRIFLDNYEVAQANITYRNTNTIDFVVPSLTPDKYHVWIYNPDGGSVVKPIGLQFVSPPTWQTVSIPAATQYSFYSTSIVASSLETLTYSSTASLPPGLSLTPSGVISGYPIASAGSYFIGIVTKTTSGVENTKFFTFNLSAGSFTANVDIMTVAGGAGGAHGGGGAGGFRITSNNQISSQGNIAVVVGAGGTSAYQDVFDLVTGNPAFYGTTRGGSGGNSIVTASGNLVSRSTGGSGGGAGAGISYNSALPGGSGGGGAFAAPGYIAIGTGGSGNSGGYTPPEGYAGGNAGYNTTKTASNFSTFTGDPFGLPLEKAGGGGGGAGGPGLSVNSGAFSPTGGAGGPAIYSTFTGANVAYAGGGGGGGGIAGGAGGGAGAGAGGAVINSYQTRSGGDALPNTGSGGGGYSHGDPVLSSRSGTGGSGIVYVKLYPTFGLFTGGNLISQTNGVSLYEFKTSNTFVISNSVVAGTTVTWITSLLSNATRDFGYYQKLQSSSQVKVYYELYSGSLPDGIVLRQELGELTGNVNPTAVTSNFAIKATNVFGSFSIRNFTINVQTILTMDYLVVAGGGGGGGDGNGAGGGGAGGYRNGALTFTANSTNRTISVIVGAGGGSDAFGTDSTLGVPFNITSTGGGRGARRNAWDGGNGGSGGGGNGFDSSVQLPGLGNTPPTVPSQGNNGGEALQAFSAGEGGGGGGAGGAGQNAADNPSAAGNGGPGSQWLDGNYYAGGGGGGIDVRSSFAAGTGGIGGGGNGAKGVAIFGGSATVNSGSGGGGGTNNASGGGGGSGGSGVVILRYEGTSPRATGGNVTISGGYVYHRFTSSSSLSIIYV